MRRRERLDLDIIDCFIKREIAQAGGRYPDWLRKLDLFAIQELAIIGVHSHEGRLDDAAYREEMGKV